MNAVAAIISRGEQVRIARTAHDLVEVDHPVELRSLADPVVDLISDLRLGIVPTGVPYSRDDGVPRNDRRADDLHAPRLHARYDVLRPGDDLVRGRFAANVVGAHEQHHVAHSWVREDIPIEAIDAGRTCGGRLQVGATSDRVAANALVYDRAVSRLPQGQPL